jgi:hypothetical protein
MLQREPRFERDGCSQAGRAAFLEGPLVFHQKRADPAVIEPERHPLMHRIVGMQAVMLSPVKPGITSSRGPPDFMSTKNTLSAPS